jgi:hypothetical protein
MYREENKLITTPIARVSEKPFTIVAPKVLPNQNRMADVISAAMFESRMDGQARLQAWSKACLRTRPAAQLFLQTLEYQDVGIEG